MIKAVIFDFDGIIVDSEPLHYQAFQMILEPLGCGYSWADYTERYMGFDDRDAFREAFKVCGKPLSDADLEKHIAAKAEAFQKIIASGVKPYPGVVQLVRELAGRVPVALCSGALPSDIFPVLEMLDIRSAFSAVVTAADVAASKPDPASYNLAVESLQKAFPAAGITGGACIAIEDTPAGIASATGAGLRVVGVTNSYPADHLGGACLVTDSLAVLTADSLLAL